MSAAARGAREPTYALKRPLDVCLSAVGMLALAPVLAGCALAVRLSSAGPALFRQERVGLRGRPFLLLKFRSMRVEPGTGALVTASGDPRITAVGRWLRRTKLDELPQLVNVLRGDMSLVGPRPEVRRYVERFPEAYERILRVRPGITDLAAIEYRTEETILAVSPDPERTYLDEVLPAKIELYERYLDQVSLRTDLSVLARTILALTR